MVNKSEVIKDFDQRSANYGSWFKKSLGTKYIDHLEKTTLLKLIDNQNNNPIIAEIGPGRGRIIEFLERKLKPEKYFCIEISSLMAKNLKKDFGSKISVIQTDGSKYKLTQKADLIISIRQIKYNLNYKKQLRSTQQALKDNGKIIIEFPSLFSSSFLGMILPNRASKLINPFTLKSELVRLGFKDIKFIPLRYLPDNLAVMVNSTKSLVVFKNIEKILSKILPPHLAKSVYVTGTK